MTTRTPPLRNPRLVAFVVLSFLGLAAGLWWLAGPIAALHALPVLVLFAALWSGWFVGERLIAALRSSLPRRGPPVLA